MDLPTFLEDRMDMVIKPFRIGDLLGRLRALLAP
jgi:DNA-binding response OmpR family regulator